MATVHRMWWTHQQNMRNSITDKFCDVSVTWEDAIEELFERKKLKPSDLVAEARERGRQAYARPVEVGARGPTSLHKSATSLLLGFYVCGRSLRKAVKELSKAAVRASQWL